MQLQKIGFDYLLWIFKSINLPPFFRGTGKWRSLKLRASHSVAARNHTKTRIIGSIALHHSGARTAVVPIREWNSLWVYWNLRKEANRKIFELVSLFTWKNVCELAQTRRLDCDGSFVEYLVSALLSFVV